MCNFCTLFFHSRVIQLIRLTDGLFNRRTRRVHISAKAGNAKIRIIFFLYLDDDSDHSQNFIGSKLDKDPYSHFFQKEYYIICSSNF